MLGIVAIIGHHNSGKTRLIANLIPVLASRGLRVGTIKHAPHLDPIDATGSDTALHLEAGAARVLLWGEQAFAEFAPIATSRLATEIRRRFADCDLVLVEGTKRGPFPKVEVYRRQRDLPTQPLAGEIDVSAVITADSVALPDDVVQLKPGALEDIADLIEELALASPDDGLRPEGSYATLDP